MPISAKLYSISQFPAALPVNTVPVDIPGAAVQMRTKLDELGTSEYGNLRKLQFTHDLGSRYEGIGYSETQGRIDDLIFIADERVFPLFIYPEQDWLFCAYSRKATFDSAIRRIASYAPPGQSTLVANRLRLDLTAIKAALEAVADGSRIRGGWFNHLQLLNVEVAYLGGDEVCDSDDWSRYEANGDISALKIDIPHFDEEESPIRIMLTKDATIVCFRALTEYAFLNICIPVFNLAKQYIIE